VFILILLHLERLDAVRKLDELNTALEARFGHVCADLWQQVVVASRLAADPYVLESSLRLSVSTRDNVGTHTSLVGRLLGSGCSKSVMYSFASLLTSFQ
jgi:hypothetical protein